MYYKCCNPLSAILVANKKFFKKQDGAGRLKENCKILLFYKFKKRLSPKPNYLPYELNDALPNLSSKFYLTVLF